MNTHELNDEEIFSSEALSARDQVTEWVNIKKNVGDKVSGVFLGFWESPAQNGFKAQLGLALKRKDEVVVGVNVTDTTYMRSRVEASKVGDRVGLQYVGEKDTGQIQKAKIVKYYNPDAEERNRKGEVSIPSKPIATVDATDPIPDMGEDDKDLPF